MTTKTVADINQYSGSSVNPLEHPEQLYELYSVPSFETGYPEIVKGKDIGSTKITVEEGDVLVCKINPRINRVWVVKHNTEYPLLASSEWIVVRNKNIDANYLKWYFSSPTFRTLLNSQVAGIGGSLTRAQPKQVAKYSVPVPSRSEQQQVSENLDKVNELIVLRKEQLAKLDQLVKSRFIELFGDPEQNIKGWPVRPLGELCSVGSSKRIYQNEQSTEGVPFWRISDLVSKMDTGTTEGGLFITVEKYSELKQTGLVPVAGDILVTSRGTLGRCYIIKAEDCFYFQDGMISWLSNYSDRITPLYLQNLFTMSGFRKQIDSMQAGSTVAYLSIAMLKKLQIMVPSRDAQAQFATFIEQTDKSKLAIQQSLDKLELLKKSLMQEYFG